MKDFEITPEILEQFKIESKENIERAESALLLLEKSSDQGAAIHELFRSIHTIKGSADYLSLSTLKETSHAFESVLDRLRISNPVQLTEEQSNLFFDVLDVIARLVSSGQETSERDAAHCNQLVQQLKRFNLPESGRSRNEIRGRAAPVPRPEGHDKAVKVFKDTVGQQFDVIVRARNKLHSQALIDPGVRGMLSRALQCIGNASQFVGEDELEAASGEFRAWVLSPGQSRDAQQLVLKIDGYLPAVQGVLGNISERCESRRALDAVTEVDSDGLGEVGSGAALQSVLLKTESKTVRVDQGALDGFMNLVGELIVARNAFSHIQGKLTGSEEDRLIAIREFRESSDRLTQITGELQRNVMEMRLIPIKTLFQRYPRIVRDVCRKTAKKVEVIFEGEDTEIDKGIADQISEPLIHIVRNAVDHGIESAEDRKRSGKTESGTLIMKASHQGNFVVIEVTDDGGGINLEKIRTKAIERGLINTDVAGTCGKQDLLSFIFDPGFSTAAAVTDISGRGVGLDVVKTNLKKIKGSVSVSTEVKQGTCFRLEVPLTIAIMRALLLNPV